MCVCLLYNNRMSRILYSIALRNRYVTKTYIDYDGSPRDFVEEFAHTFAKFKKITLEQLHAFIRVFDICDDQYQQQDYDAHFMYDLSDKSMWFEEDYDEYGFVDMSELNEFLR